MLSGEIITTNNNIQLRQCKSDYKLYVGMIVDKITIKCKEDMGKMN